MRLGDIPAQALLTGSIPGSVVQVEAGCQPRMQPENARRTAETLSTAWRGAPKTSKPSALCPARR